MNTNSTKAIQVRTIVQQLASFPGSQVVDITSKKLPRLGPAEAGTSLQISTRSFDVQKLPETYAVPDDSEEIVIRLHGWLSEMQSQDALLDGLHSLLASSDLKGRWDTRARFKMMGAPKPSYEFTVFSNMPAVFAEPLA